MAYQTLDQLSNKETSIPHLIKIEFGLICSMLCNRNIVQDFYDTVFYHHEDGIVLKKIDQLLIPIDKVPLNLTVSWIANIVVVDDNHSCLPLELQDNKING